MLLPSVVVSTVLVAAQGYSRAMTITIFLLFLLIESGTRAPITGRPLKTAPRCVPRLLNSMKPKNWR
jgi:hypothetical protein